MGHHPSQSINPKIEQIRPGLFTLSAPVATALLACRSEEEVQLMWMQLLGLTYRELIDAWEFLGLHEIEVTKPKTFWEKILDLFHL